MCTMIFALVSAPEEPSDSVGPEPMQGRVHERLLLARLYERNTGGPQRVRLVRLLTGFATKAYPSAAARKEPTHDASP